MVWIDGQNLFHRAKAMFGHRSPDYDIRSISQALCERMDWDIQAIHFYSGIPPESESPRWRHFWDDKLRRLKADAGVPVHTFTPELRYRSEWTQRGDGQWQLYRCPQEKGVDVRLALDMVAAAYENKCDAMVIMTEDSDLQQAVDRCLQIARSQDRKLLIANAFPHDPSNPAPRRSLRDAIPLRFDRDFYETHLQAQPSLLRSVDAAPAEGPLLHPQQGAAQMNRARMALALAVADSPMPGHSACPPQSTPSTHGRQNPSRQPRQPPIDPVTHHASQQALAAPMPSARAYRPH